MYVQVDDEGPECLMMSEIVEHQSDAFAVRKEYGSTTQVINEHRCKTTKRWQILVAWKDGISK